MKGGWYKGYINILQIKLIIMMISTFKIIYKYTERALTPAAFSGLIQEKLDRAPLREIMHQFYLYDQNVLVFDYDYYQRSCYRLLDFQKQISLKDLYTVLKMGQKHNVRNQLIWRHYEAELHNRLHQQLIPLLQEQKEYLDNQLKLAMSEFQKNSQDFFEVLKEGEANEGETEVVDQVDQVEDIQPINYSQKMKKSKIFPFLNQLAELLILYGTKRIDLLKLTLEAQSHPEISHKNPASIIRFAQTFVYTCQTLLEQYETNKKKYTARSIKKIYKFQDSYFPDFLKMLEQEAKNFTIEEIRHLIGVMSSFPIKKRVNKKMLVGRMAQQLSNRSIDVNIFAAELEEVLGKDKKLIKNFRSQFNIEEQTAKQIAEQ